MTLKYILVYHKCLSVYSAVHFNHIPKAIEIMIQLHIMMLFSLTQMGQKKVTAFIINVNYKTFSFNRNEHAMQFVKV